MAQAASPTTGQKRRPGRPPREAQPALKKTKISTNLHSPLSSAVQSPTAETPTTGKEPNKLPHAISAQHALPTLPQAQAPLLSSADYQSIASSAVLQASLDRSRLKWTHDGLFERYWVKPESGKNARPPPPNNPDLKWQKHKGPCRIRIEPHIFEVEMYVEEKAKPQPVKQYVAPQSAYGQPYRQGQQQPYGIQQNQFYQNRTLPPAQQPPIHLHPATNALPRMTQTPQPPPPKAQPPPAAASPQPDKKPAADPVISMLATRASSDPALKALMKEVATGNATQDQLKIFQGHIDDLQKVINEKKQKDEEAEAAAQAAKERQQASEMIQYDGVNDNTPPQPQRPHPPFHQQHSPYQPQQHQQHTWQPAPRPAPTPPAPQPVIIAFTTPGATEDRFLFPQHSILEPLSPQHLLASFIVTRRGSQAADATDLDPKTEYWQPVTLMVEVAYNREHLIECVKKWVKPPEEVRKHMEAVMERCTRAPETWLALRLPYKGSALAAEPEEVLGSVGDDVVMSGLVEKKKKPSVKYVKKADKAKAEEGKKADADAEKKVEVVVETSVKAVDGAVAAPTPVKEENAAAVDAGAALTDEAAKKEEPDATESGRPKRITRKSVRISEG